MNLQPAPVTPLEASRILGIGYRTIKRWILEGKLETSRTPGGHHRIAWASLRPYLEEARVGFGRVSGANQYAAVVTSIKIEELTAEVILACGDFHITSIITAAAARELNLQMGEVVTALIKSTDVMIERLDDRLS